MIRPLVSKLYQRCLPAQPQGEAPAFVQDLADLAESGLFDSDFYATQVDGVMSSWEELAKHYLKVGAHQCLDPHPLFDTGFYVENNTDVSFDKVNPLLHFVRNGWLEGRDPHPLFDASFYLEHNPDVGKSKLNPLVHFVISGAQERRDPCEFFSSAQYLEQLRTGKEPAAVNLLVHFVSTGVRDNLSPHPLFDLVYRTKHGSQADRRPGAQSSDRVKFERILSDPSQNPALNERVQMLKQILKSDLFDKDYFIAQIGSEPLSWLESMEMYLNSYAQHGADPHPLFDTRFYIESNADVDFNKVNPFFHYITRGWKENRNPHPLFDPNYYLKSNKDLKIGAMNPVLHFMRFGAAEKRKFSPLFDSVGYEKGRRTLAFCKHARLIQANIDRLERGGPLKEVPVKIPDNLRVPGNCLFHFLTHGPDARLYCLSNLDLFFEMEPPKRVAGRHEKASFWRLRPRDLQSLGREKTGLASIARRLQDKKLSGEKLATLIQLMQSLTIKENSDGFLESDKTIFLTTHESSITGAPLLLLRLAKGLTSRGWECVVVTDRAGPLETDYATTAHVINLRNRSTRHKEFGDYVKLLFDDLGFAKPKVCLLNSLETARHSKTFSEAGIKIFNLVHEIADTYSARFLDEVLGRSELVIFPAEFVRSSARKIIDLDSMQSAIISNALLDKHFGDYDLVEARARLRTDIGAAENAQVVLACGTPELRKGIDIFVSVAKLVHDKMKHSNDVHFVWIGVNKIIRHSVCYYVEWDVRQAELKAKVHFLPVRKDIRSAFHGADIFMLPSRQDPFPCVVHNAMAAKLPVVAFADAGGVPEMIAGGGGTIVPYGDVVSFADAICQYLVDEHKRTSEGALNARLVNERFDFDDYLSKIEAALTGAS